MSISTHFRQLRDKIGHDLLQIPGVAAVIHDQAGRLLLQQNTGDHTRSLPAGWGNSSPSDRTGSVGGDQSESETCPNLGGLWWQKLPLHLR
jgi:hypothetical protein